MRRIYLDHAATTPVDPQVLEAMLPYLREGFGNASSLHSFGREASEALGRARSSVARLVRAREGEVVFTSGGTESDNLALLGAAARNKALRRKRPRGPHVLTSTIEHPAVLQACEHLADEGFVVGYLPVDRFGLVDPGELARAITPATFLVSVMAANNEVGTVEPVAELGAVCHERGVLFHTDAVQAAGKVPLDVGSMGVDLLSISGHKLHGPKGVGALIVRDGVELEPILHGGGHERGLRSGTENVPGIAGLGRAAELAAERLEGDASRMARLRDRLIAGALGAVPASYLNGHPVRRLPNNAHLRFDAVEGESLVLALDSEGVAASSGSACSSHKGGPSHVLTAIGLDAVQAQGSLRLTLGRGNTDEEVERVLEALPRVVARLRELSPLWKGGGAARGGVRR